MGRWKGSLFLKVGRSGDGCVESRFILFVFESRFFVVIFILKILSKEDEKETKNERR